MSGDCSNLLTCSVEWDNPHGGVCDDVFQLSDDGMLLTQTTTMDMLDGQHIHYKCAACCDVNERILGCVYSDSAQLPELRSCKD